MTTKPILKRLESHVHELAAYVRSGNSVPVDFNTVARNERFRADMNHLRVLVDESLNAKVSEF